MNIKNIVSRRSFIFCPGLRPDMFPKAVNSGTDIVCIELEDGIAPKDKYQARNQTLDLFTSPLDGKGASSAQSTEYSEFSSPVSVLLLTGVRIHLEEPGHVRNPEKLPG